MEELRVFVVEVAHPGAVDQHCPGERVDRVVGLGLERGRDGDDRGGRLCGSQTCSGLLVMRPAYNQEHDLVVGQEGVQ